MGEDKQLSTDEAYEAFIAAWVADGARFTDPETGEAHWQCAFCGAYVPVSSNTCALFCRTPRTEAGLRIELPTEGDDGN